MSDPLPPVVKLPTPEEMRMKRVEADKARLRLAILSLRKQVRNPVLLDSFLACVNPATSIDGRLPFTPVRVITVQDKLMCLHNLIGHAVLKWGRLARGEADEPNTELDEVLAIAAAGFVKYGAYPRDRNSVIHVLRTADQERELRQARRAADEKALEARARFRGGESGGEAGAV